MEQNVYAWYLGKQYLVTINPVNKNGNQEIGVSFDRTNSSFVIYITDSNEIPIQLKRFYTRETKRLVSAVIDAYKKMLPQQAKKIEVKDSHAFWGQCTSKQELIFNYRLSMMPEDVIQYVVIHELCHLMHMNHDRSFWRLVGKFCPNYEEIQLTLDWYQNHI